MTFVYLVYGESWYKGSYVVLLVLMPFFYFNYGVLIPLLVLKRLKLYLIFFTIWVLSFIWVYSYWTIYQDYILNNEVLRQADYIETFNNVIYIWLISTGFCLLEFWIKNRAKNSQLLIEQKTNVLKSEQNVMLNKLLSDYFTTLDHKTLDELPDKILLVSDFFKYLLYNGEKPVKLKTEIEFIKMYEELKNSNENCLKINYGLIDTNISIKSSQVISIIDSIVTELFHCNVVEIVIESLNSKILVSTPISDTFVQEGILKNDFFNSKIIKDSHNYRLEVSVEGNILN